MGIIEIIKNVLSKIIPDNYQIQYLAYLPKFDTWVKKYLKNCPNFKNKFNLYDYLQINVIKNNSIDYLEFGVFQGEIIKYWAKINKNPSSQFFGFDTFTGFPEVWKKFFRNLGKKVFNTNGRIPQVQDNRIQFIKGLFQNTLDIFLNKFNPKSPIIIHNDSDLYSSTLFVLTKCNNIIKPGTIILFDEFSFVLDEFRAFMDYSLSYLKNYRVLGYTYNCIQIAIQII